jgi:uncharacterized protein YdaU (DUF1376 family)
MPNPPAFQLYASDFYMDTASWSPNDVGIYFRLLIWEWINGPIPDDLRKMARIAGCDPKTLDSSWRDCLGVKFIKKGFGHGEISRPMYQGKIPSTKEVCGWENSRLEQTRKEQQEHREKLANSGRLGGLKTQKIARKESSEASSEASSENQALQSSSSTSPSKKNKIIKELYLDFVMLSKDEHEKLIVELGEQATKDMITRLNNYLGSTGKKYKSHYFTILNWKRKDFDEPQKVISSELQRLLDNSI